jgi:hypothetical protein
MELDVTKSPAALSDLPSTTGDVLQRVIAATTHGQVRDLSVSCGQQTIVLRGTCSSYYSKQLATKAVIDTDPGRPLRNELVVVRDLC